MTVNSEPNSQQHAEQPEIADPRDLTIKPDYITEKKPEEVVDNPAVTPQMLDDNKAERGDLKRA
ncbi:MAG: hypothetical protein ACFB4I_14595 [Cyanophyceae cyanobacterium]